MKKTKLRIDLDLPITDILFRKIHLFVFPKKILKERLKGINNENHKRYIYSFSVG
jgi:hypothetical protein